MVREIIFAFALATQPIAAGQHITPDMFHAPTVGVTFQGGPYDGLTTGTRKGKDGKTEIVFIASPPGRSPVPDPLKAVVDGLIHAYETSDSSRYRDYVTPDAVAYVNCTWVCDEHYPFLREGFPFESGCEGNAPFYMKAPDPANGIVRIEWVCGGALRYLTFLSFRNGKIDRLSTVMAAPPMIATLSKTPAERNNAVK